jgi:mannose-6-phosphate isomerase
MELLRDDARVLEHSLWWSSGADHANGGFEELLDLAGSPVTAPRRARVQARQVYVYATAGALGWQGPWREAVNHGLDYFVARYFRPDGLVRASVSPIGAPADEGPVLYDQAFGLLALAAADGGAETADRARALIGAIDEYFRSDGLGYRSGDPERPFQSNPHMHLFEASLAWMALDPSRLWSDLAERIAALAMTRFVDAKTGALREFFDDRWAPAAGVDGTIVEPGHQFEWAWLLYRWAGLSGSAAATTVANRLVEIGAGHGIDHAQGVAINALDDGFAPLDPSARLWPQTEWIKAALLAAESSPVDRERHLSDAVDGIAGLKRYLLPNGTWRDKLGTGGAFVEEPAPASSLYHIVGAIAEVTRAARSTP